MNVRKHLILTTKGFHDNVITDLKDGGLWNKSLIIVLMLDVIFRAATFILFYKWSNNLYLYWHTSNAVNSLFYASTKFCDFAIFLKSFVPNFVTI